MTKNIIITTTLLLAFLFTACKKAETPDKGMAYTAKGDTIFLHADNSLQGKIILGESVSESVSKEVITAGTIQAIPTQFAYIAPPFSGRVTKSHIHLGQRVERNTPLFEIMSPDFTAVQKEFFQAQSEKEMAQKDLTRKEDLIKNGVGSQREYEEALNALRIAEKEYENAYSALKIYHVEPEQMVLGQALVIRAPISGNIIENNVITGQYLHSDTDPVAIVADLNEVWVTAQVKEKDIRFINEGDNMNIHVSALPDEVIQGTVYHIEEMVDEDTRSIKVLSICNNPDEMLKLGMYATVHFAGKVQEYTVIPEKAVLQGEDDSYIYVLHTDNVFVKQPVNIDFTKNGKAYLTKGLAHNKKIVCEGGYYFR